MKAKTRTRQTRTSIRQAKTRTQFIINILIICLLGLTLIGVIFIKYQPSIEYQAKTETKLDVPIQNQFPELPNGCEVTSLSMLLNYYNIKVSKMTLAHNIKHVSSYDGNLRGNPNIGFVGYMGVQNAGWCVYNQPLYDVARKYTNRIQNITGSNFEYLLSLVATGKPVLIITTLTFAPVNDMQTWQTKQGEVKVTPSSHACLITGYNKNQNIVYVNNPYGHKNQAVNWKNLAASYKQQGSQALYIK